MACRECLFENGVSCQHLKIGRFLLKVSECRLPLKNQILILPPGINSHMATDSWSQAGAVPPICQVLGRMWGNILIPDC